MAKTCRCCGRTYDDLVFYCASCLRCNICGQEMTPDLMYRHCADLHVAYADGDSNNDVKRNLDARANCPSCPGTGNPNHLAGHIMSSHASCRVRL